MDLSILICSLDERRALLARLMKVLQIQVQNKPNVEILVKTDNRTMTIGKKRNLLVQEAQGKYSVFIDDDDLVDNQYVRKILAAIQSDPDCCGIEGTITFNGGRPRKFIHSIKFPEWCEKGGVYFRSPNHLNPIRSEIVKQVPFLEINQGEDHDFSKRIFPLLKSEVFIPGRIYTYLYMDGK